MATTYINGFTMASFRDKLEVEDRKIIDDLRRMITSADKAVNEREAPIMSAKDALLYEEEGVMKYGLAQTKNGFTFHTMVMYVHQDIAAYAKTIPGVKQQKGCLNIGDLQKLNKSAFAELMRQSAAKDFSTVIAHYNNKR